MDVEDVLFLRTGHTSLQCGARVDADFQMEYLVVDDRRRFSPEQRNLLRLVPVPRVLAALPKAKVSE